MRFDEDLLQRELRALRGAQPSHGLGAALAPALGVAIRHFEQIGSTNDEAIEAARRGAEHGTLFIADNQTAGRGRRGRSWASAPGENLLFSLLLRPNLDVRTASRLTLAVGLAVRDAAQAYSRDAARIKWPNDVWVGRKKLAGILVESQLSGNRLDSVVIGVGVNVLSRDLPSELADLATSLALCEAPDGAPELSREGVLARLLIQLERRISEFEQLGLAAMLDELRVHDALLGARVKVDDRHGVARGIDQNGALVLEEAGGNLFRVETGTVEFA